MTRRRVIRALARIVVIGGAIAIAVTADAAPDAAPGDPMLTISPATIDGGSHEVTSGSATAMVHLANAGGGMLAITDVAVDDTGVPGAAIDWTYTATGACTGSLPPECDLAAGQSIDLAVTFDPMGIGARDASLRIGYTDTAARSTSIPLTGKGTGATLELMGPTSIDLGTVAINQTQSLELQLVNRGSRDLHTVTLGVGGGPISVTPPVIGAITPTSPVAFMVQCHPTAPGPASTTVHIASSDAAFGSPIDLAVVCNGATTSLVAQPSSIYFGEVRTNSAVTSRDVDLVSTAGQVSLMGPPTFDVEDTNLAVSDLSQTTTPSQLTVTVTPKTDTEIASNVRVSDTDGNVLAIPVAGRIATASFAVPTSLSLGTFCVSSPTTPTAVALESTGTATIGLPLTPTMLSPTTPFDLQLASPVVYPTTIVPGALAAVELAPKQTTMPGTLSDQLVWSTDVDGQTTKMSSVTALFVSNGGAIAPSALDFGQVPVHLVQGNGKRVTLQNCDTTTLLLDAPTVGDQFSIISPNFPTQLMPNETTTFSIGFSPVRLGKVHEQLVVSSSMLVQPLIVDLFGEGITGDGSGDDDGKTSPSLTDSSFYACGCRSSEPSGALCIGAAAIALMIPRRRRRPCVRA